MQENDNELSDSILISKETQSRGILEKIESLKNFKSKEVYDICLIKYSYDISVNKFCEKFLSDNPRNSKSIGLNVKIK